MASSKAILDRPKSLQESPLHQLLQDYKVSKGEPFNFTYMAKPFGSFMVPKENYEAFYKAYTDTVKAGHCATVDRRNKVWLGLFWLIWISNSQVMSSSVVTQWTW